MLNAVDVLPTNSILRNVKIFPGRGYSYKYRKWTASYFYYLCPDPDPPQAENELPQSIKTQSETRNFLVNIHRCVLVSGGENVLP